MMDILEVRAISALETHLVRHPVLRPGRPVETCVFEGDDLQSTIHFGGFFEGSLVAVATFMKNGNPAHQLPNSYQVRGMAVLEEVRGKQFGKIVLTFGEEHFAKQGIKTFWLNAREIAVPFYQKLGYTIIGDAFNIPLIGTHFAMFKKVT